MSKQQRVSEEELATLKGKTVIITGGASGIGLGAARLAHKSGANITIADIVEISQDLKSEFGERAIFVKTDVTSWESVSNLFKVSHETFGSTDIVLANAGINLPDNLLEEDLDEQGKLKEPQLKNIDVNLRGVLYCTKLALFYFRKQPGTKCQLVVTGSVASLIETPPLYSYCASKAAVLGLMRGLRGSLKNTNITINMIAPWMTVTDMLPSWIREKWGDLPANDVAGVAAALLLPAVRPHTHGKTLFVGGNEAIEIEQALDDLRPRWLGQDMAEAMGKGQKVMGIE